MRCCGSPQNICRPNATKMRCCEAARHRLCPPSATCLDKIVSAKRDHQSNPKNFAILYLFQLKLFVTSFQLNIGSRGCFGRGRLQLNLVFGSMRSHCQIFKFELILRIDIELLILNIHPCFPSQFKLQCRLIFKYLNFN